MVSVVGSEPVVGLGVDGAAGAVVVRGAGRLVVRMSDEHLDRRGVHPHDRADDRGEDEHRRDDKQHDAGPRDADGRRHRADVVTLGAAVNSGRGEMGGARG